MENQETNTAKPAEQSAEKEIENSAEKNIDKNRENSMGNNIDQNTENKINNSSDQNTEKKKIHLGDALKVLGQKIMDVFRDYPVTMIAIMIAALIGSILVCWHDRDSELNLERAGVFCLLTAMQTIAFEEIFAHKKKIRLIGYGISAILAGLYVFILSSEKYVLFGVETDTLDEIVTRILVVHGILFVSLSIHHMFRRLEDDFEIYATKAFLELIKSTVIYGLFALGLALIIVIFNELIFDTDDFLEMVEIFLAGGIYVPMCLKSISGKNEEPGKFSRICFLYVLQPMLLLAFAIIYLYVIKLFLGGDVSSNHIFYILGFLFAIGMPIWTIVHGMKQKEGFLSRATAFLPYVFLPFILLQCWSIGLRISSYGMTPDRYFALVFILCEIIYFVLYFLHHRGNKQAISWILYAIIGLSVITLLFPGLSYDDVVIRSQMNRMTKMLESPDPDEASIKSAYRAISRVGYKGDQALATKLTKAQTEQIESFDEYGNLTNTRIYLHASRTFTDVDVSAYRKLYAMNNYRATPQDGAVTISVNGLSTSEKDLIEVNLKDYLDWILETFDESYDRRFNLDEHYLLSVNDRQDLYLTTFSIDFNSKTKEITSLTIGGYLLEK